MEGKWAFVQIKAISTACWTRKGQSVNGIAQATLALSMLPLQILNSVHFYDLNERYKHKTYKEKGRRKGSSSVVQ